MMPFQFIEEISSGDIAFEATGKTPEELFISACDAIMNVMIENLENILPKIPVSFSVEHKEFDLLLFKFLSEIIFIKDAQRLLFRIVRINFAERDSGFTLEAKGYGEPVDQEKKELQVDVKAVTLHRFQVKQNEQGWKATVVLDV
ncbi:MAG: archease [Nitrospiria bacterium]